MGKYAVTGSTSGIGAEIVRRLKSQGHDVITIDIGGADINTDLGTIAGREKAVEMIKQAAPAGLDGFVPCAGVGPHFNPVNLIAKINYFGATALVTALKNTLAKKRGSVVLISSNSAWMSSYDTHYMEALLRNDEKRAEEIASVLDGQTVYGGGKQALARWMRRQNLDFAHAGIRMNAIAPGYTRTNMTAAAHKDPNYAAATNAFVESIPIGRPGEPADQAEAAVFLLSEKATFISGIVLFVDGGHDAMFRPDQF